MIFDPTTITQGVLISLIAAFVISLATTVIVLRLTVNKQGATIETVIENQDEIKSDIKEVKESLRTQFSGNSNGLREAVDKQGKRLDAHLEHHEDRRTVHHESR
jgi:uncharacterized membrane-anchored protein YhcB (DUF1043 family)